MVNLRLVASIIAIGGALAACSGTTAPTSAQVTTDLQTVQTIASAVACQAQAGANAVTAGADVAGDTKLATTSSASSVAFGKLCTGLPVGSTLTP